MQRCIRFRISASSLCLTHPALRVDARNFVFFRKTLAIGRSRTGGGMLDRRRFGSQSVEAAVVLFTAALCRSAAAPTERLLPAGAMGFSSSSHSLPARALCLNAEPRAQSLRLRGGGAVVTIKTLKGEVLELEVDAEASVLDLKRQIAVLKGYPSSEPELTAPKTAIKLIHLGKILTDDVKIAETVIPPSFLVMMPPKVATPPQPSPDAQRSCPPANPSAPDIASTAGSIPSASGVASPAAPGDTAPPISSPAAAPTQDEQGAPDGGSGGAGAAGGGGGAAASVQGGDLEQAVTEIMAMGFSEAEAYRALRLAFNNPHRAVDILLQGGLSEAFPAAPSPSPTPAASAATAASSSNDATLPTPEDNAGDSGSARAEGGGSGGGRVDSERDPGSHVSPPQPGGGGQGDESALVDAAVEAANNAVVEEDVRQREGEGPLDFLRRLPQFTLMRQSIQMQVRGGSSLQICERACVCLCVCVSNSLCVHACAFSACMPPCKHQYTPNAFRPGN